jgi:hypothetical protein
MADCVFERDCPLDFECKPEKEEIKKEDGFAQGYELQCIQEPCTCVPMWHMYDIDKGPSITPGLRERCTKFEDCCDEDEFYKKKNCTSVKKRNEKVCETITCEGKGIIDLSTCESDVCNDCNIKVNYKNGNPVKLGTCSFKELPDTCLFDETIQCPESNKAPKCSVRPSACPKDWNIQCVIDPCVCRPVWANLDVRFTPETCKRQLEPPCIPYNECPNLPCLPLTEVQLSNFLLENIDIDNLICIPQPCTCIPMFVPNFYGYS